ncbi:preprotein translocase subunit SecA [Chitinispirillum alkaliphilum]|nr:preprotein translocase subunit SecA [Chitinispirillum alkaliphilum]
MKSRIVKHVNRLVNRLNGNTVTHTISDYIRKVKQINSESEKLSALSDRDLKSMSQDLTSKFSGQETKESMEIRAFALVKETIRRVLGIVPFDEQIVGGLVLNEGKIAQMQTGEGKTLTAVFAAYFQSLAKNGVHIFTFNDYLARRDALWMGPVFDFLGKKVGYINQGMSCEERRSAYNKDITYLTARESGFDFLRDGLVYTPEDCVRRGFPFAIVDEADSILIDEARTPLVIAGDAQEQAQGCVEAADAVKKLQAGVDFDFDQYSRNCTLTEKGTEQIEKHFGFDNLYENCNSRLLSRIYHALHAQHLLQRDRDYIVKSDRVVLVDEFTGRTADRRRWPDGLQAAVEAKEGCTVMPGGVILNSITLQHFINLHPAKSGMTATAEQAQEELRLVFGLHIVVIPPHRPCIRLDQPDTLYRTKQEKNAALLKEISDVHSTGRPVLVGTSSITESEEFATELRKRGIVCEVLNARDDSREASIISQAGRRGAVTISTNMAGRGTDIRLGGSDNRERDEVAALGGLLVIGTNRHESSRIDKQLRGRAGRQGDHGCSKFFISLEDELFVKYKLDELLPFGIPDSEEEMNSCRELWEEIDRVQRIIEGQNLEIKLTLYKYSVLLEQQRNIIKKHRDEVLNTPYALKMCRDHELFRGNDNFSTWLSDKCDKPIRELYLYHLDKAWSVFLEEIRDIQDFIHLRRYGSQDPLFEFRKLTLEMFHAMLQSVDTATAQEVLKLVSENKEKGIPFHKKSAGATWTYLVNDNPFDDNFGFQLSGNIGLGAMAALLGPLTALLLLAQKAKSGYRRNIKRHSKSEK